MVEVGRETRGEGYLGGWEGSREGRENGVGSEAAVVG